VSRATFGCRFVAGAFVVVAGACREPSEAGWRTEESSEADSAFRAFDSSALEASRIGGDSATVLSAGASDLPPIPGDPLFTNLVISGFPEAVVSVPNGATSRRPVLIVLHGSGDRPDWNCDAWRHITGARGFVLCPRGADEPRESTKDDRRYTHRGGAYLRDHVEAAIGALRARFADYVDAERPLLAGFSLGAIEVAKLALDNPSRFPRVAVIEGGHGVWTGPAARAFAAHGGLRVLLGCGSAWCVPLARDAAVRLSASGVEAHRVYAHVGHTTDRPLQEAIMTELPWFLGGDPRWSVR
jgi:predicted esterase